MKLILLRESNGDQKSIRVGPAIYLTIATAVLSLVLGTGYLVSSMYELSPAQNRMIAEFTGQLAEQRGRLIALQGSADRQSMAMGKRLAELQARVLRMEALGERVTDVAKINSDEFSFGEPVALGGPEAQSDVASGFEDFDKVLDELATTLGRQERQLRVLESVLVDDQFKDAASVQGRPVQWGWLSSAYGQRMDPISGKAGFHQGVDFAGREDSQVIAVASGVVVFSGKRSGFGHLIEINHGDGYVTRYAHHKEALVGTGQVVKRGQQIAVMGSTGRSTGPHVHFEVLKNGRHQDPAKFVKRRS